MTGPPLILGAYQRAALRRLRDRALAEPVETIAVMEQIKTKAGHAAHIKQMDRYSITIPIAFRVTFTIKIGHPAGTVRHMSLSTDCTGRLPTPQAIWAICQELGFAGSYIFDGCEVREDPLSRDPGARKGAAINVIQPVDIHEMAQGE